MLGNGSTILITHTSFSDLPCTDKPLKLKNLLCVHSLEKNLIAIRKLCKDNNVLMELFSTFFLLKIMSPKLYF